MLENLSLGYIYTTHLLVAHVSVGALFVVYQRFLALDVTTESHSRMERCRCVSIFAFSFKLCTISRRACGVLKLVFSNNMFECIVFITILNFKLSTKG